MERRVAAAAEIPPGSAKSFTVGDREILLCNVGGSFYAIDDVCTHDGGPLDQGTLEGYCAVCPRHGATFDVRSGAATLPAVVPIDTYAVREEAGDLFVEL
ncbi:MAG TPA: non-heme iron oxygenase ferredoxin subunit [Candidatus Acidoferrales bacterium]|nr:non-heme iron oxygenase ferredoxin subunit [Candidatus Acidoferrales bacterium]